MAKWFVTCRTGYCGEDSHDVIDVDDSITEDQRDRIFNEMANENAAGYGRELCSDDCDDEDCENPHPGDGSIEGWGVPYNPDEHDGYSINGKW